MTSQMSLAYSPAYAGGETWKSELEALRSAVNYLGLKEVSYELDVSGSAVSDALNERDRKRWAGAWTHIVIAMLAKKGDELAVSLIRGIEEPRVSIGPHVLHEEVVLTSEQLAAGYEAELRSMGIAGESAISRVRRSRR